MSEYESRANDYEDRLHRVRRHLVEHDLMTPVLRRLLDGYAESGGMVRTEEVGPDFNDLEKLALRALERFELDDDAQHDDGYGIMDHAEKLGLITRDSHGLIIRTPAGKKYTIKKKVILLPQ